MKIKHWMTTDPITVTPDTLIVDAKKIMKDHRIRRLPVVEKGKLAGIVTYRNIIEASPSAATSLSIHELNYLILKLTVKDVMKKKVVTVSPEDSVIDVILEGHKKGVGAFPVVENDKLIGIVTETEIVNSMVQLFGTRAESEIIGLENVGPEDAVGVFRRIAEIVENHNLPLLGMFALPKRQTAGNRVYIRVKTKNTKPLIDDLVAAGFEIGD
ncbi:MAG: CBS and ACT domain-containing protein [Proteobacteria bacterium]|nr:CBS and ACT domain-containing protein [Pseudomonadota bacterium]